MIYIDNDIRTDNYNLYFDNGYQFINSIKFYRTSLD